MRNRRTSGLPSIISFKTLSMSPTLHIYQKCELQKEFKVFLFQVSTIPMCHCITVYIASLLYCKEKVFYLLLEKNMQ